MIKQNTSLANPSRIKELELPGRAGVNSARQADLNLLKIAPKGFLDATHFDTVRFPPPPWALKVFNEAANNGDYAYSPYRGNKDVLETLAGSLTRFMDTEISIQNIILAPGTQAGLFIALSAIAEQGTRVALMSPDYLFSARILRFLGADIGYIPIHESSISPTPDLTALEDEFTKGTRILVFSNPNNPTGYVYSENQLNLIAGLVNKYDVTVVIDSLYSRLLHNNQTYTHLASLPGMQERVITLLGPSKTESLSGYRLGVVIGPVDLMPRLENVLSVIALRAPGYSQHLLSHWLTKDEDWINGLLKTFTNLREMTIKSFRKLPWLKIEPQGGTAYAWPDVSALGMPDEEVAKYLLKDASVLVSPGYQFGVQEQGHFRVCYARDENQWSNALDRIAAVLHDLALKKGID